MVPKIYLWYPCSINVIQRHLSCYPQISTSTGNTSKGFDGRVFVSLVGTDGVTPEKQLSQTSWYAPTPFQASANDVFTVNAMDVGQLKQLNIRVEGGGSGKWPLEFVDVINQGSGKVVRTILFGQRQSG